MTSTTTTTIPDTFPTTARTSTHPVRRILAVDAAVCLATGGALVAGATTIADRADLAGPGFLQVIGAFLVVLGVDLALFARASDRWARFGATVTAVGDAGWVAGSLLLAATAGLPAWATAGVLAQAVVVLGIAAAKVGALRSTAR